MKYELSLSPQGTYIPSDPHAVSYGNGQSYAVGASSQSNDDQNGFAYTTHVAFAGANGGSQKSGGGLTQSKSFHGIGSIATSPEPTYPNESDQESSVVFSPSSSMTGPSTEPKNYAPRTSGQPAMQQPPPKFNLDVVAYKGGSNTTDPFVATYSSAGSSQLQTVTSSQVAGLPMSDGRLQPSEKLAALLGPNSALISFQRAMQPDFFPFGETCRTGKAINHGVVKIRNVSNYMAMY